MVVGGGFRSSESAPSMTDRRTVSGGSLSSLIRD